jgi:thiosulfate/3-mercaptopyruvate sulfurtransferase
MKGGVDMESRISVLAIALVFLAALLLFGEAFAKHKPPSARTIDPIISTDWLEQNLDEGDLVIIDIRSPGEYAAGHIPSSINEPFVAGFDPVSGPASNWIVGTDEGLWLEIPPVDDLFDTIGDLGITKDSRVVIVTTPNPDPQAEPPFYGLANGTRVAFTLIYAGVKNVAILDGGYPKWIAEGKVIETEAPEVKAISYRNIVNKEILASRQDVKKSLRRADIVDARDTDVYFGVTIEPFANKAGHIPGARSLPAPWIWALDSSKTYYTYKDAETLEAMASGVLREPWGYKGHKSQDIIVYCGVGGYASSWWFVLTQVLGYENVKLYDGAAQEWVKYYDMVPYRWE